MNRRLALVLLLVLPPLGALWGTLAGPFFARADDTVTLAARIHAEESQGLKTRTDESERFRRPIRAYEEFYAEDREDTELPDGERFARARRRLYAKALEVERRFRVGAAVFGAWCALVIALKLLPLASVRPRAAYEIAHAECVACGRCFLACPHERARLKKLGRAGTAKTI